MNIEKNIAKKEMAVDAPQSPLWETLRRQKITLYVALLISITILACSNPSGIYIDIKKQAIVSCDGTGLKEIKIESDSNRVTMEGTEPIIYFNRKNSVSKTSIYGDAVYNYVLKLRTNCNYTVTKDMGFDRGPFTVTFKTDSTGKVIEASSVNCD